MNILRRLEIRVSRQHRATVVRTDRHMLTAAGRHVDLFMLNEQGSWVHMGATPQRWAGRPEPTAWDLLRRGVATAAICTGLYAIGAFILAVGPDRW